MGILLTNSASLPVFSLHCCPNLYFIAHSDILSSRSTIYLQSLDIRSYPVYHSVYETFDLVRTFVDPGFRINKAVSQLMIEIARRLIDDPILPLNCVDYGAKLAEDKDVFIDAYGDLLTDHGIDISRLFISKKV